MPPLTDAGERLVTEMAQRHDLSEASVRAMLAAVVAGGGTQAQFDIAELGGMGQWSRGGMTMVGDMFNQGLKAKVDALCTDLSEAVRSDPQTASGPRQSQWQGGERGTGGAASGFFAAEPDRPEWPEDLGTPSATGSQNGTAYAVFPAARRLALSEGGRVRLFDTGEHRIGGVSQAQSGGRSLSFSSQLGTIRAEDLPEVTEGEATASTAPQDRPEPAAEPQARASTEALTDDQIFARLEKLGDLRDRGILTDEDFAAKKAELLARL